MGDKAKEVGKALAEALKLLPSDKTEYFFGFADGVKAASAASTEQEDDSSEE